MKYDRINVMVPTYKRIANGRFPKFVDSMYATASSWARVCLTVCVNEKDKESLEYAEALRCAGREVSIVTESTRFPDLARYFNMMYDQTAFKDPGTLVSMLGDDMVFVTPGWDVEILREMNNYDGIGFVWCNDDYVAREKCPVNLFTTRKTVDATEQPFMCPLFQADMIDVVWGMLGEMTGCGHFLPDVVIRHEHSTRQHDAQWDESFKRLFPVQRFYANKKALKKAQVWAAFGAANLVNNGLCQWSEAKV